MSIGYRIRQARKSAQKSMRDLASDVGISAMAISKYERDINVPRSSVLLAIAKALGVQVEYFFRPPHVTVTIPEHRRCSRMSANDEAAIIARTEEYLERYLEVESLFPDEKRSFEVKYLITSAEDAEEAAVKLRKKWKLGLDPIRNLTEIFEDEGIKVILTDGVEGFDICTFIVNGDPVFAIRNDFPGDSQRFNLVHELGFIILQNEKDKDEFYESTAHRFAGAFLVPADLVRKELGNNRKTLSITELYLLKHKYGMSMRAWVSRAHDLGIITDSARSKLVDEFVRLNWRNVEPGRILMPEISHRFERLVFRALSEGYISQSRAEELLAKPTGGSAPETVGYYEQIYDA